MARILLCGIQDSSPITIEGSHSSEIGFDQPKYFDGVMNYAQFGYPNPNVWQINHPRKEANPIKFLWAELNDDFFQKENGGHEPTFAIQISLDKNKFDSNFR